MHDKYFSDDGRNAKNGNAAKAGNRKSAVSFVTHVRRRTANFSLCASLLNLSDPNRTEEEARKQEAQ